MRKPKDVGLTSHLTRAAKDVPRGTLVPAGSRGRVIGKPGAPALSGRSASGWSLACPVCSAYVVDHAPRIMRMRRAAYLCGQCGAVCTP